MKINERTHILCDQIVLVPYDVCHVLKYHEWMKNKELQILTASEPLTLDEEYSMQTTWRNDENKCTFIILDKATYVESKQNEIDSMIGDVNLFFNDGEDVHSAELEVMIAESWARGQGRGIQAICAMMKYGMEVLNVERFTAKIGYSNEASLKLFNKLGFQEISRSGVFEEITLELSVTEGVGSLTNAVIPAYKTEHQPR